MTGIHPISVIGKAVKFFFSRKFVLLKLLLSYEQRQHQLLYKQILCSQCVVPFSSSSHVSLTWGVSFVSLQGAKQEFGDDIFFVVSSRVSTCLASEWSRS